MDIVIIASVDEEDSVDPDSPTGLTEEAYLNLVDLLSGQGYGIMDVEKTP